MFELRIKRSEHMFSVFISEESFKVSKFPYFVFFPFLHESKAFSVQTTLFIAQKNENNLKPALLRET